jgi:hypothetical protein
MPQRGPRPRNASGGMPRSTGAAAGRGALLIVLGLAVGVLLLGRALDDAPATENGTGAPPATDAPAPTGAATAQTGAPEAPTTTAAVSPLRRPEEVKVLVLNGNGVSGIARVNQEALLPEGYTTLPPADGPLSARTVVYYTTPGFEADSRAVADLLTIPTEHVEPFPPTSGIDPREADVVVLLGQDNLHRRA